MVVSHPLQVLSHCPDTLSHKPCAKIVRHLKEDSLLRCKEHHEALLVVKVAEVVVDVDVVMVVVSQLLQVRAHFCEKVSHRLAANKALHCNNGKALVLLKQRSSVVVVKTIVVVVGSHPLHVLSHWPRACPHKPCAKTV